MNRVALRMLFGDPVKFLGLVFGVAFATLLISQQSGLFVSLMSLTSSQILDTQEADVWVMDPGVEYLDTARPMRDTELARVRGVPGVAWAVPFFKGNVVVRTETGIIETAAVLGVDDVSLVGVPQKVVLGDKLDLAQPDAVAVDLNAYEKFFPGEPLALGRELQINDRRAVVRVVVNATPSFSSPAAVYCRYARALQYTNNGRNQLSFILVRAADGVAPQTVADAVHEQTGLRARTSTDFVWETVAYVIAQTGIAINFGTTVVLGVIVGIAIVGLTFNLFVQENLKQYAALKAIGVRNSRLAVMVLLQAAVIGFIGFSIGIAGSALFFKIGSTYILSFNGFWLPWQVALSVAGLTLLIMLISTVVSLRRVLFIDPAVVFRG